jgi:hypothetical protein
MERRNGEVRPHERGTCRIEAMVQMIRIGREKKNKPIESSGFIVQNSMKKIHMEATFEGTESLAVS